MKCLLYLGLAALLLGCKKDAPEVSLPAATQTGANTAGCLIDGKPFIATGWGGGLLSNGVPALSGGFSFDSLYAVELNGKFKDQNTTVTLFFRSQKTGNYFLNKNTLYYPQGDPLVISNHATFQQSNTSDVYITNVSSVGNVTLKYANVSSGISAGTFEFVAASKQDPNRLVTITSGRFDRKQ